MLIGEYAHSLDEKGRVSFPAKLREDLGECFYLTKGLDGCLAAYSEAEWQRINDRAEALPTAKTRNLKRFLFSSAAAVTMDKQGRVLVPPVLREYAALTKDVVIIGASDHAEVWDKDRWAAVCGDMTSDSIAEAMDELGF